MTKKNELTEAENSAIRSAECVWLDRRTLAGAGVIPPDNSDITVFSRLRSAASELADAIDLLQRPAGGGEMARLLLQMQEVELYVQSQAHYRAQLDGLIEPLQLLSKATEELIVAGAPPNHAVRVWVSMAAEAGSSKASGPLAV